MGLFDSTSKKSTTNNVDNRATNAAGNTGLAVGGDRNFITVTDNGATNKALDSLVEGNKSALDFAESFGESAFDLTGRSVSESFDFSAGVNDRAFDAIDHSSALAYDFVGDAFDSAISESQLARESAVGAALETNKRIDDIYSSAGRESADQSFNMLKVVAVLVGVIGLGVLIRA